MLVGSIEDVEVQLPSGALAGGAEGDLAQAADLAQQRRDLRRTSGGDQVAVVGYQRGVFEARHLLAHPVLVAPRRDRCRPHRLYTASTRLTAASQTKPGKSSPQDSDTLVGHDGPPLPERSLVERSVGSRFGLAIHGTVSIEGRARDVPLSPPPLHANATTRAELPTLDRRPRNQPRRRYRLWDRSVQP